jgi:predicted ATPase with chaperone activity
MVMNQLQLATRVYHWALKLWRSITDLAGIESIEWAYLADVLEYRPRLIFGCIKG